MTLPSVISTSPSANAIDIKLNVNPVIRVNTDLIATTVTQNSIVLRNVAAETLIDITQLMR
jgi:hypothetical protein